MKITGVKIYPVKGRKYPPTPLMFVEVETDEGITGLGESGVFPGIMDAYHRAGEILTGESPFNVEKICEHFLTERPTSWRIPRVISGIEIALWDIIGQSLGAPIYNLLGGRCRDKIRVYCDNFEGDDDSLEGYVEGAKKAVARGFTGLKLDIDGPYRSPLWLDRTLSTANIQRFVDIVEAIRETIGPDVQLAVDCHCAFNVHTAITVAEKLEPYKLLWYEDPVPTNNLAAMAKVAENTSIPICTGEHYQSKFEFRELFEKQAAEIIMPDIAIVGGILEMKKIAAMADACLIPVSPHNVLGPVATMACVHMCTCIPNFINMEYQGGDDVPYIDELIDKPVPLENGYLKVPEEPGLGIALNKTGVAKYRAE